MMEAPHPELWVNVRPDNEVWGATAIRVAGVDRSKEEEMIFFQNRALTCLTNKTMQKALINKSTSQK